MKISFRGPYRLRATDAQVDTQPGPDKDRPIRPTDHLTLTAHNDVQRHPQPHRPTTREPAISAGSTAIWMDGKGWSATDGGLAPTDGASTLLNGCEVFVDEPLDARLFSLAFIVLRTGAVGGFLIGFGDCVVVRLQ